MKRTLRLALVLSALGFAGGCVSLTPAQKDTRGRRPAVRRRDGGGLRTDAHSRHRPGADQSRHRRSLPAGQLLPERQHARLRAPDRCRGPRARALRAGTRTDLGRVDGRAPEGARSARARRERQGGRDHGARQRHASAPGGPDDGGLLRSAQNAQNRGQPNAPGHRPPSEEIADLLARFPEAQAPTGHRSADRARHPRQLRSSCRRGRPETSGRSGADSPRGSGTFVWSVDREEVVDGTEYYVDHVRADETRTRRESSSIRRPIWRGAC